MTPIDVGCGGMDVCEVEVGYTFISSFSLIHFTMRNFIEPIFLGNYNQNITPVYPLC